MTGRWTTILMQSALGSLLPLKKRHQPPHALCNCSISMEAILREIQPICPLLIKAAPFVRPSARELQVILLPSDNAVVCGTIEAPYNVLDEEGQPNATTEHWE